MTLEDKTYIKNDILQVAYHCGIVVCCGGIGIFIHFSKKNPVKLPFLDKIFIAS